MGVLGVKLMLQTPWIGFPALAALVLLTRIPRCPAAPIVLAASAVAGWATSGARRPNEITFAPASRISSFRPGWRYGGASKSRCSRSYP